MLHKNIKFKWRQIYQIYSSCCKYLKDLSIVNRMSYVSSQ